jgi:hypothetical protein
MLPLLLEVMRQLVESSCNPWNSRTKYQLFKEVATSPENRTTHVISSFKPFWKALKYP